MLTQPTIDNMTKANILHRIFRFYYDGFRAMTLGRVLWTVILIKLFILFAILKVFFFPNYLKTHADKGAEHEYVATELTERLH